RLLYTLQSLFCSRVCSFRAVRRALTGGRDQNHLAGDVVEHDDDRRADQERIRRAERIRWFVGKTLDEARHVVAEIAEEAGRHGRQLRRDRQRGTREQFSQALQRRIALRPEGRISEAATARLCTAVAHTPDEIRFQPDDRVAAAKFAPLYALKQKCAGLV